MFENKITHNGIHYTRYIASWTKVGQKITRHGLFQKWLKEQEQLTDQEIYEITELALNGKLELEESVRFYLEHQNN